HLLTTGALVAAACLALALAPGIAAAHTDSSRVLRKGLARALAVPHVASRRTGALAFDLRTGATLYSVHPTLPLAPASNEKLAVTLAALRELGPLFTIDTDVRASGTQVDTTWKGDLILVGHGDPTLSTE